MRAKVKAKAKATANDMVYALVAGVKAGWFKFPVIDRIGNMSGGVSSPKQYFQQLTNFYFTIQYDENREYFMHLLSVTEGKFRQSQRLIRDEDLISGEGIREYMNQEDIIKNNEKNRILSTFDELTRIDKQEDIRHHAQLFSFCLDLLTQINDKYANIDVPNPRRAQLFLQDIFNFQFSLKKKESRTFLLELFGKVRELQSQDDSTDRILTATKLNEMSQGIQTGGSDPTFVKEQRNILDKISKFSTVNEKVDIDSHAILFTWALDILQHLANKVESPSQFFRVE